MKQLKSMKNIFLIIFSLAIILSCKTTPEKEKMAGLITNEAMVVSAREEVSKIGVDILKKGGNAFDAMVATELALAVAYPYAGNIGGGGFMVYRKNTGEIGALDYREKAPLASSKDMFLDEQNNVIKNKSTLGAMAVGIPGTVAGVFAAHKKFGSLPISDILTPVIALAKR
jgi:gamma-glutamyltranspeptidase/glutathione hydrolase